MSNTSHVERDGQQTPPRNIARQTTLSMSPDLMRTLPNVTLNINRENGKRIKLHTKCRSNLPGQDDGNNSKESTDDEEFEGFSTDESEDVDMSLPVRFSPKLSRKRSRSLYDGSR
jgi:hypothetical protein